MARMVEVRSKVNGVRLEGEWGESGVGQRSGLGQQLGDYLKCNGKLSRFEAEEWLYLLFMLKGSLLTS